MAAAERMHLLGIVLIVLIVVLPVIVLTPWFAWRYRYRNTSAPYTPNWTFSRPLEFLIWGVPFAIVIGLAVWLWQSTTALDPYAPLASNKQPLHIEVVGYDWKWLFIYPRARIATVGQLAFPVGRPLSLELTSDTVMQAFFVPALGSQIYAMPGMITHLHLEADSPGQFLGENTQFNGLGFEQQKFTARALTPADYSAWLKRVSAVGIRFTPVVYDLIRQRATKSQARAALHAGRSMPYGDLYFTGISPQLFDNIVRSFHGGSSTSAALLREQSARVRATDGSAAAATSRQ